MSDRLQGKCRSTSTSQGTLPKLRLDVCPSYIAKHFITRWGGKKGSPQSNTWLRTVDCEGDDEDGVKIPISPEVRESRLPSAMVGSLKSSIFDDLGALE